MGVLNIGGWTLRRRVTVLFATTGVLLALVGIAGAITAFRASGHIDVILERTGPMRVAGHELTAAYLDQETGIRGYALSGDPADLAPYERGRADESRLLARLEELNAEAGSAAVARDVTLVRENAGRWRTEFAEPLAAAVGRAGRGAATTVPLAVDRSRFDALRRSLDQLQLDILATRNVAAEKAKRAGSVFLTLETIAAVVIIVVGAVLVLLLDRLVRRPVTRLAGQVREVADGDYHRPIDSTGAPELSGLARDVDAMRRRIAAELTEVRHAREQIEAQAEELTRSNRDLEQFAYVASHDLQEPLRKVASFCQLLQRRYAGQLDERADQYIGFAVDGAQRMQRLINDLLAFSRIGRLTSGFADVDLNRVLAEVRSQLEGRAGADARIEWVDLPVVEGEEPLLTTLFVNLIGNSLKFRRAEVPPVVSVSARREGDEWLVNVRDNGIGIEAEFADKVFVIFQRLHGRDAYEGTGIGLAIVKKIVEYHGGRIWLDLDVTEGTSVWFTLPLLAGVPVQEKVKEVAS